MDIHDLPVPAVLTSRNFIIVETNFPFTKLFYDGNSDVKASLKNHFANLDEFQKLLKTVDSHEKILSMPATMLNFKNQIIRGSLSAQKIKNKSKQILLTFIPDKESEIHTEPQPNKDDIQISFNHIPDPVIISSASDGKFKAVNIAFENVSGYSKNEILENTSTKLGVFHVKDEQKKLIRLLEKNGRFENQEVRLIIKSGKVLNTLATVNLIEFKGEPCFLSVIKNITDTKEAQNMLAENERKLKTFLNVAPVGIGMAKDRVITYVNNTFCMMTGYTEDEVLGQKSSILYPDLNEYKAIGKFLYRELKDKGSASMETKFRHKNGLTIDVILSASPVEKNSPSEGIVFSALDISEKKRSEFLKDLVYTISNAVVSTPNLYEFIKTIRIELGKVINTLNFFIALYDKETDSLSTPYLADEKDNFTSWPSKKTLTGYVVKKRKPLFITKDEIIELKKSGEIELVGTVSEVWIGIPLIIDNESFGALVVQDYDNPFAYSKDDFNMLTFISSQVSISLQRKKSEDIIRHLQKKVQLQIRQMPNGLITWDKNFQVESWNPSAEHIFGFLQEDVIGKHAIELIFTNHDYEEVEKLWSDVIESRKEVTQITENRTNSGAAIICRWQFTPLKNEEGEITGALSMVEDITEKEIARKELIESEEKYKNLVNHSPDGIFTVDLKGKFKSVNTAICDFTGKTEQELLKMSIWDIIPAKLNNTAQLRVNKLQKGQNMTTPLEYELINKDGKTSSIEVVSTPIYENGSIAGFQSIARDVTFRKKAQKEIKLYQEKLESLVQERTAELEQQTRKLRESHSAMSFLVEDVNKSREELVQSNNELKKLSQAIEQSPVAVIITDTEGNIEYVNKHFCEVTGYNAEEVAGKNPRIQNSGVHSKEFFSELWKKIKSGENWHGEICNTKKNKEKYWEFISISPLRDGLNNISHFIAVKEDITQRKVAEKKLKEYTEELEVFNKAMVDRELKIIEMKEQVNKLSLELGREIIYEPVWK